MNQMARSWSRRFIFEKCPPNHDFEHSRHILGYAGWKFSSSLGNLPQTASTRSTPGSYRKIVWAKLYAGRIIALDLPP